MWMLLIRRSLSVSREGGAGKYHSIPLIAEFVRWIRSLRL
jgi:hypothetical protein